jgi:DNA-binding SARP family transcriptional activator
MGGNLSFVLLGAPQLYHNGVPLTGFARKKSLALLCYLAVTGRPHSREALAGLLWGETTETNARTSLRQALVDVRRSVDSHVSITLRDIALDRERAYRSDVAAFDRRVSETLARHDDLLADESVSALAQGVDLYRGDLMEGFYVRRAPAFEEWVALERERLRLSMLQALHVLAAYHARRGRYVQAASYVARVLALEPGQEEGHRKMMALLALSGQRGAAVRQYEICCRTLARELGVGPDKETICLYEQIRSGAFVPQAEETRGWPAAQIVFISTANT